MDSLLNRNKLPLKITANVTAATEHLKKDICMGVYGTSLMNKPPLLHNKAAKNTAPKPF